jgi:hypothetical protein
MTEAKKMSNEKFKAAMKSAKERRSYQVLLSHPACACTDRIYEMEQIFDKPTKSYGVIYIPSFSPIFNGY